MVRAGSASPALALNGALVQITMRSRGIDLTALPSTSSVP